MKFLHTADLHLGRRLNDIPLLEDQKAVLNEIVRISEDEAVDAVILAGDIYDKSVPGADAMSAFDEFINILINKKIKVFMISGNHDSGERISYFSGIISKAGVYTSGVFDGRLQKVTVEDMYGELDIYLLPFIRPIQVRKFYPDEEIVTYEDAVRTVINASVLDRSRRNMLIAHQFIIGAEISDSEEFAVGGLDAISVSAFDGFDYVALGHLHKPQKVKNDSIRYAGSPLKYSISEANHRKSVTIVEMNDKNPEIKQVPLPAVHDVREVKGLLADVMEMEYSEDYIRVILTDEIVPPDARVTVSTVFPNMIALGVQNSRTEGMEEFTSSEDINDKSKLDLFLDFFKTVNGGAEPEQEQVDIMKGVLEELEEERHETN